MWWKFRKTKQTNTVVTDQNRELRTSGRAPLNDVTRKVKEVELVTKRHSSEILSGQYRSRFKGQGMQFSDFRVYQFGDDTRHIDWRTTARMQETYVKTFEEERELNIVFCVDVSPSVLFGSQGASKRESIAVALASLGFSAIANGDRVGLLLFSDQVERFVPSKKGKKHILRLIDEIITFQPKSKGSNLSEAISFLSSTLPHNSIVILASDFFASFETKKLEMLSKKHDVVCIRANDKRDAEIPDVGLLQLEDLETGELVLMNTGSANFRDRYKQTQNQLKERIGQTIRKSGASLLELDTALDPALALREFFMARKRAKK